MNTSHTPVDFSRAESLLAAFHNANQELKDQVEKGRELMYYTQGMYKWSKKTSSQAESLRQQCKTLLKSL